MFFQEGKINAGPVCILCEFVIEKVESLMRTNRTEAEIEAALKWVCDTMPKTIRRDCETFVEKYSAEIIGTMSLITKPSLVCVKKIWGWFLRLFFFLGLCGNGCMYERKLQRIGKNG